MCRNASAETRRWGLFSAPQTQNHEADASVFQPRLEVWLLCLSCFFSIDRSSRHPTPGFRKVMRVRFAVDSQCIVYQLGDLHQKSI